MERTTQRGPPSVGRLKGRRLLVLLAILGALVGCDDSGTGPGPGGEPPLDPRLVEEGREIFRFDTFGDEAFWTDTARLHEVMR